MAPPRQTCGVDLVHSNEECVTETERMEDTYIDPPTKEVEVHPQSLKVHVSIARETPGVVDIIAPPEAGVMISVHLQLVKT